MGRPLVVIEWEDSAQAAPQWQWLDSISEPTIVHCVSVGFLVGDTDKEKRLAISVASRDGVQEQASGIIAIPVSCIVAMSDLTSCLPASYDLDAVSRPRCLRPKNGTRVGMEKGDMQAAEYLKRPYGRLMIPESDGTFVAEIFEFPGCYAVGATASEALANLEEVAVDWIQAALDQGQSIPEPMESVDHSGKLVLRMSKGLHKKAAQCAEREGVSLNTFIVTCLAEQVGLRSSPLVIQPPMNRIPSPPTT